MTADRVDELIALATLGELTAAEQRELDTAASSDRVAVAELGEALATAAALQQLHAEEPPARLRDSVTPCSQRLRPSPERTRRAPATTRTRMGRRPDRSSPNRRRWRRSKRTAPVGACDRCCSPLLLTAAAVALFAAGGVLVMTTNNTSTSDPIAAVIQAPDATSRPLTGQIAGVTVVYSASEDAVVVTGEGLAVLDDSATHRLWLMGDVTAQFADTDPTGLVLAVTDGPAGGSPTPTLPILASD